ncbi:MAG: DNA repair protein RecO C-terminal domain-containing protein [Spirochaetes bacterium]|nr:DNA repair protein RecO C-terminal domain-containing protein [Spirochaetota bacterium]
MPREAVYNALVLRAGGSNSGALGANQGANREAWFLTSEEGILRATVFGGAKSKLRSYASPFHSGKIWIYHNPVKDTRKLNDFDVQNWRAGLRELYERTMAAAAVCETILASAGGGGDWAAALSIAQETLDALEHSGEPACRHILLCFFFNWADFLGILPGLDFCGKCGKKDDFAAALWYDAREGEILCPSCKDASCVGGGEDPRQGSLLRLGPGCRRWFAAVRRLSPQIELSKPASIAMDNKSSAEAKAFACALIEGAVGRRLSSWDW